MLIYLACPYTDENDMVEWDRKDKAIRICAKLMNALPNDSVLCPIIQGHEVKWWIIESKPREEIKFPPAEFWYDKDIQILAQCSALYVLCLDGWKDSTGVRMEIDYAKQNNMPIVYINENLEELDFE